MLSNSLTQKNIEGLNWCVLGRMIGAQFSMHNPGPRTAPPGLDARNGSILQTARMRRREVLETLETGKRRTKQKVRLLRDTRKRMSRVLLRHKVPPRPSADTGPPLLQLDKLPDFDIRCSTVDTNGRPLSQDSIVSEHNLELSPEVPSLHIQSRHHPRPLLQPQETAAMSDFNTEAVTEAPQPIQPLPPDAVAQPTLATDLSLNFFLYKQRSAVAFYGRQRHGHPGGTSRYARKPSCNGRKCRCSNTKQ